MGTKLGWGLVSAAGAGLRASVRKRRVQIRVLICRRRDVFRGRLGIILGYSLIQGIRGGATVAAAPCALPRRGGWALRNIPLPRVRVVGTRLCEHLPILRVEG